MWLITGLLGAAVGYFAGWFFNLSQFVNWILTFIGFVIGAMIGADTRLQCPNCKSRDYVEHKETKILSEQKNTSTDIHTEYIKTEHFSVGEEQLFFKCNKCKHEWNEVKPYKRRLF